MGFSGQVKGQGRGKTKCTFIMEAYLPTWL